MVYLWQQFPLPQSIEKFKSLEKLHSCDLCAGVWIYGILSFFMGVSLLQAFGFDYVPVVSEAVTGGAVSFMVHIFLIGFREKFLSITVV